MNYRSTLHRHSRVWLVGVLLAGIILSAGLGRAWCDERFIQVDLSGVAAPISFPEYVAFIAPLPNGSITLLSRIPFVFSKTENVHLFKSAVTVPTHADDVKAVHFLINATGAFPGRQVGDRIGTIVLTFSNHKIVKEPLLLGINIREWRQIGDCGETINTITSRFAHVEFVGEAPSVCTPGEPEGIAVIDGLTVPLDKQRSKLVEITVESTVSDPPGIFLDAITIERN